MGQDVILCMENYINNYKVETDVDVINVREVEITPNVFRHIVKHLL